MEHLETQLVNEAARLLGLSPLVIAYLAWIGWFHYKRAKDLDIAFQKIRNLERQLKEDSDA